MWLHKGVEVTSVEQMPPKTAGFVYVITHKTSGRKYIGRKLIDRAHTRQKNNKKIRSRVESDWKTYWSSSPELLALIEEEGTDNFVREILMYAFTKGQLNFLEERFLYSVGSMESEKWMNGNIRSKIYKRNIINKIDLDELHWALSSVQQF